MKNLWKDLEKLECDMSNPIELVEAQSKYLEEGTDDLFYIEIDEVYKLSTPTKNAIIEADIKSDFIYKMSLRSIELSDYAFNIFNVYYGITFYPLLLSIPKEIAEEFVGISVRQMDVITKNRVYYIAESEEEYEELLEAIFNSETVRKVLKNMKAIIGDVSQDE